MNQPIDITKTDATALWHAVDTMAYCVRAMRSIEGITSEQIEAEKARLTLARQALRKVQQIRKAQSCRSSTKLQERRRTAGGGDST